MKIDKKRINKVVNFALLLIIAIMSMDNLYLQVFYNFSVDMLAEILFLLSVKKILIKMVMTEVVS